MIDCGFALHSAFGIPAKVITALYQLLQGCMVPLDTAAVSVHALCTCHHGAFDSVTDLFEATVIRRVHVCLAVTCRLHLWQNDRDLLRAAAVTRWGEGGGGGNGYRNLSQHRKLTLEKNILPPLLPGMEPETFRSRARRSATQLSPLLPPPATALTHTHYNTHTRTHTHTHARTHIRIHIHAHMHTRTHARTYAHTHTRARARAHRHTPSCIKKALLYVTLNGFDVDVVSHSCHQ